MSPKNTPPCGPPARVPRALITPHRGTKPRILKQEEEEDSDDWEAELRRIVAPRPAAATRPSGLGSNETTTKNIADKNVKTFVRGGEDPFELISSSNSCLNTPTMEFDELRFPVGAKHYNRKNPAPQATLATATAEIFADYPGSSFVEVIVPVSEGPQFEFPIITTANYEGIKDIWAFTGSPENIEHHAPLSMVEGRTKPEKNEPVVIVSEPFDLPSQLIIMADSEELSDEVKTEMDDEAMPLLNWITDDKIQPNSEFPVGYYEVVEEPVQLLRPTTVVSPMAALAVELPQVAEEPSSTISLFDWNSTQTAGELFGQSADAEAGLRPPPAKRSRRGRPPVPLERPIAPPLPRATKRTRQESEDSDLDYLTEQERAEWRYRRSRDLNNVASKRCRENRKQRQIDMEEEAEQLISKNLKLKQRLLDLEAKVRRMKEYYLTNVLPGGVVDPESLEKMWSS